MQSISKLFPVLRLWSVRGLRANVEVKIQTKEFGMLIRPPKLNRNLYIYIQENALKNVVRRLAMI